VAALILVFILVLKLRKKKESTSDISRDSVEEASLITENTRNSAISSMIYSSNNSESSTYRLLKLDEQHPGDNESSK
jgi:hypothetical protein